jgi:hypothetical protein
MYGESDSSTKGSKLVKQTKEQTVKNILELQRKRKKQYLINDADIHAIQNSQRIRKRTSNCKRGGLSKCQHY